MKTKLLKLTMFCPVSSDTTKLSLTLTLSLSLSLFVPVFDYSRGRPEASFSRVSRVKWSNTGIGVAPSQHLGVVANEKEASGRPRL